MGIENNTREIEVQNQELQRANREQIEQANKEHEELGKVLDGLDTLDNEAELDEISGNEGISEQDDVASQLDNNDKIEDETSEQFETINNPVYNEVENNGFSINDVNQAVDAKEAYEAEIRDMSQDEYHDQKELDKRVEENGSEPNMTEPSVLGNDLHQEEVSNKETDDRSRLNEPEQNAVDMERSTEETSGNGESEEDSLDDTERQNPEVDNPQNLRENQRNEVEQNPGVERSVQETPENLSLKEKALKQDEISKQYYDKCNEIGKDEDLTPHEKVEKIQKEYYDLGDGNRKDIQCIASEKYLDSKEPFRDDGRANPLYPEKQGFNMEKGVQPISQENPMSEAIDRYGESTGTFVSRMKDGESAPFNTRALPNIENPEAYHKYNVDNNHYFEAIDIVADAKNEIIDQSVDKMNNMIDTINKENGTDIDYISSFDMKKMISQYDYYQKALSREFPDTSLSDAKYGLSGEAAPWVSEQGERLSNGGADQEWLPMSISSLERIGVVKENQDYES